MAVAELAVVGDTVSVAEAYEKLKASGKSGLVVMHPDGARLYRAEVLDLQRQDHPMSAMRDIKGGWWLPQAQRGAEGPATADSTAVILNLAPGRARIGGLFDDVARDLNLAVRVYSCSLDSTHIYSPVQYRALPIVGGRRYCTTKDGGVVS